MRCDPKQLTLSLLVLLTGNASAAMLYVDVNTTNPVPPYTNWSTAAREIQSAVDASATGDTVLVTNGRYATGGRAVYGTMTNRVAIDRAITVQSVTGAGVTIIQGAWAPGATNGDGAIRCVYLTNGAVLTGFTLTNGATRTAGDSDRERSGGGLWCEAASGVVSNCVLTGNAAYYSAGGVYSGALKNCTVMGNSAHKPYDMNDGAGLGGGAYRTTLYNCTLAGNNSFEGGGAAYSILNNCTLTNNAAVYGAGADSSTLNSCVLTGNSALENGGGAFGGNLNNCVLAANSARNVGGGAEGCFSLNNCTLVANSAGNLGGGVYSCNVKNCILYFNTSPFGRVSNYDVNYAGGLNYCCTTPQPPGGVGNIINAPTFLDYAGGNLRLHTNSLCINGGNNAYAPSGTDFDGNQRIKGGTVDMGAYEFQNPASALSYAWLQQYGLPTDGSADYADPDHDGLNNWQEWRAGTDPTNSASALKILTAGLTNSPEGVTVTWQSVSSGSYFLQRGTNLLLQTPFQSIQSNIAGQAGTTSFTDLTATNSASNFYRVGVQ